MTAARAPVFKAQAFLDSVGVARKIVEFPQKATIYAQGDPAKTVMYIQQGGVKLSVVNGAGKEAVLAVLKPGDFFGEGCLAAQPIRMARRPRLCRRACWLSRRTR